MTTEDKVLPTNISGNRVLSHACAVWDALNWLRRATILLATEHSGLKRLLDEYNTVQLSIVDETSARILKAGAVLGVFAYNQDRGYSWSNEYRWIQTEHQYWKSLIAVLGHQSSYMNLVASNEFWAGNPLFPAAQLQNDPGAYHAFLYGVAASHQRHAEWLSQLEHLGSCRSMLDLGGGLGTYAIAWIKSLPDRRATIVDLPGIRGFLTATLADHQGQLDFIGADLTAPFTVPVAIDFILFANVLHLVPNWSNLLESTIRQVRKGTIVGVFEADPATPQGILFDLQVHFRSGRITGLLNPATVTQELLKAGLTNINRLSIRDPEDLFQREYGLWLGEVNL